MVFRLHFGNGNPSPNVTWLRSSACGTVRSRACLFETGVWGQAGPPLAHTAPGGFLKAGQRTTDWVQLFISQVKNSGVLCIFIRVTQIVDGKGWREWGWQELRLQTFKFGNLSIVLGFLLWHTSFWPRSNMPSLLFSKDTMAEGQS